jgi:hypothetical protein
MLRQITERLSSWKEIFWGKALLIGTTLWAILGAWDLIKSELLPERFQSWTVVAKTPHLSWQTWAMASLAILLGVLLEGAHTAIQKREKNSTELQAQIATQVSRGKTTMNRDWPGDWKLTEDGFRRQEKSLVRAEWFRDSLGPVEQWRISGGTSDAVHECEALCLQAGKLLVVSPMSHHLSPEIRAIENDADRWLYFLKGRYGLKDEMVGSGIVQGQAHTSKLGFIANLAAASARACIECSAKSFPS